MKAMIRSIERAGRRMHNSGACEEWLKDADHELRKTVRQVNGPLLQSLLEASGYEDARCIEMFREGDHACVRCDFVCC